MYILRRPLITVQYTQGFTSGGRWHVVIKHPSGVCMRLTRMALVSGMVIPQNARNIRLRLAEVNDEIYPGVAKD